MKYKTLTELAAAFKSGELDKHYYLMLDKGATENCLNYYNPEMGDDELENRQEECSQLFEFFELKDQLESMGIPCKWS